MLTFDTCVLAVDPELCIFCGNGESTTDDGHTGALLRSPDNYVVHHFCMVCAIYLLFQRHNFVVLWHITNTAINKLKLLN